MWGISWWTERHYNKKKVWVNGTIHPLGAAMVLTYWLSALAALSVIHRCIAWSHTQINTRNLTLFSFFVTLGKTQKSICRTHNVKQSMGIPIPSYCLGNLLLYLLPGNVLINSTLSLIGTLVEKSFSLVPPYSPYLQLFCLCLNII